MPTGKRASYCYFLSTVPAALVANAGLGADLTCCRTVQPLALILREGAMNIMDCADIFEFGGFEWLVVPALPEVIDALAALDAEAADLEPEHYE
jgi:hypothetical protein